MKKKFEFNIGERVALASSKEKGRVIGRAKYETGMRQYLVRYVAADGRQEEAWFGGDALHQQSALEIISTSMREASVSQGLMRPTRREEDIAEIKKAINAINESITAWQSKVATLSSRLDALIGSPSGRAAAR